MSNWADLKLLRNPEYNWTRSLICEEKSLHSLLSQQHHVTSYHSTHEQTNHSPAQGAGGR